MWSSAGGGEPAPPHRLLCTRASATSLGVFCPLTQKCHSALNVRAKRAYGHRGVWPILRPPDALEQQATGNHPCGAHSTNHRPSVYCDSRQPVNRMGYISELMCNNFQDTGRTVQGAARDAHARVFGELRACTRGCACRGGPWSAMVPPEPKAGAAPGLR